MACVRRVLDGGTVQQQVGASGLNGASASRARNVVADRDSDIACVPVKYTAAKATVPLSTTAAVPLHASVKQSSSSLSSSHRHARHDADRTVLSCLVWRCERSRPTARQVRSVSGLRRSASGGRSDAGQPGS